MLPLILAQEPDSFDEHVRKRGAIAIKRLLGEPVQVKGRKPKETYAHPEEIPAARFPEYWAEPRRQDGQSALDDMMAAYNQCCAYLSMRLERATGSPTIDHYVPKHRDWRLVYEWSNYRLAASCVNGAKGERDVIDPRVVQPGWFALDLNTGRVRRGEAAPAEAAARMDETLAIVNLRQCVAQRLEYITLYRAKELSLDVIARYAPFIAHELRRQGTPTAG